MTTSAYDPASRVRLIQFIPHLTAAGWNVTHCPNRPDRQWSSSLPLRAARAIHYRLGRAELKVNRLRDVLRAGEYDVVFVNRDLAGGGTWFEKRLLARNPAVVFDFDDAIFLGSNRPAIDWMCQNAAWVTPGNEYLARYARQHSDRVTVIPTVIDTDQYRVRRSVCEEREVVRVGWSGSDQSIAAALFPYLPLLRELQSSVPFELVIVSNTLPRLPIDGLRWRFRPWSAEEEGRLSEHMDIGIMPLVDDEFQRGKCGLKLLQYMAAGLPTIASPVGVNREITIDCVTGFLASSKTEWQSALTALVSDRQRRIDMGLSGRRRCESGYSVRRWLPVLLDIFQRVQEWSAARGSMRVSPA